MASKRSLPAIVLMTLLALLLAAPMALAHGDQNDQEDHESTGHHEAATTGDHRDQESRGDDHHHGSSSRDHDHGTDAHDHVASAGNLSDYVADVSFTLQTGIFDGKLGYRGVGGDIDGVVNPTLYVPHGAVVEIVLINGDGIEHDIIFPSFEAASEHTFVNDDRAVFAFQAHHVAAGTHVYFCGMPGHRAAGQEGLIVVTGS